MRLSFASAAVALFLAFAAPAAGQVTYSYQGNPFTTASAPYTTSMSISGSFEVGVALAPSSTIDLSGSLVGFSFFDGVETRDQTNSLTCQFEVTTNAAGAITGWNIWLRESGGADPQHSVETRSTTDLAGFLSPNSACGAGALNPFASTVAQPGVWSGGPRIVVVPTASEIGLVLLTALLAACAVWRLRF
ncbi:MAG TPA: IPTL-CTERM sorting domain-containing protein [Thermoanaerobaculia bacterium]|nr:IPTL-CTERM sorting domain-containing protein [Thermoanaerobaculia bacterium]